MSTKHEIYIIKANKFHRNNNIHNMSEIRAVKINSDMNLIYIRKVIIIYYKLLYYY